MGVMLVVELVVVVVEDEGAGDSVGGEVVNDSKKRDISSGESLRRAYSNPVFPSLS